MTISPENQNQMVLIPQNDQVSNLLASNENIFEMYHFFFKLLNNSDFNVKERAGSLILYIL